MAPAPTSAPFLLFDIWADADGGRRGPVDLEVTSRRVSPRPFPRHPPDSTSPHGVRCRHISHGILVMALRFDLVPRRSLSACAEGKQSCRKWIRAAATEDVASCMADCEPVEPSLSTSEGVMAQIVLAQVVMAQVVMAQTVMAQVVMAQVVMALAFARDARADDGRAAARVRVRRRQRSSLRRGDVRARLLGP